MSTSEVDSGKIQIVDANPTKDFFITMLTRDITLVRSIIDLVDNSVDAANASEDLENKWIKITLSDTKFSIQDNCGGIAEDIAMKQAFRFGRPSDAEDSIHSVGRFGVGMKRTLFKLGQNFVVTSHHQESSFEISVDVNTWLSEPEWEFELVELENDSDDLGAIIEVSNLHQSVMEQFTLNSFINDLDDEIGLAHFKGINNGLQISINGTNVEADNIMIKQSEKLNIVGIEKNIGGVDVTIRAGIGPRDKHEGGWYIVCNGRLIAAADQSKLTGWDADGIQKYHPDYAYFRGIVDFECDDSDKLPWTTTKTGVDSDNGVYRSARTEMRSIMRKIIPFLKEKAKETSDFNKELIGEKPMDEAIESAEEINIFEAEYSQNFISPEGIQPNQILDETTVTYKIPTDELDLVKEILGASTAKEVGLETFNYFYENECED